jgi:uncharacterized iron-regulated protein
MFPAQIIKDASMANKVNQLLKSADPLENFLVICGTGHMMYGFGVPERILNNNDNSLRD